MINETRIIPSLEAFATAKRTGWLYVIYSDDEYAFVNNHGVPDGIDAHKFIPMTEHFPIHVVPRNGLKSGINFFLPKSMEFELSSEKKTTTNKIINEVESREYITEKLPPSVISANGNDSKITTTEIEKEKLQSFNETYTDNIVKEASVMKEKQIELKKMEIAKDSTPPGNITVVTDAKKVSGDTVVSNNTNVTNHRVDSLESSSNALLNYFRA